MVIKVGIKLYNNIIKGRRSHVRIHNAIYSSTEKAKDKKLRDN